MLDKLLKEIIILTVGKPAEPIAELLNSSKHINEFTIAKKLGITINQTRNILYKISNFGLVSSIRKKDKKKGWYTYSWKFEIFKCLIFLKNKLLDTKMEYKKELQKRKSLVYYYCDSCKIEHGENEALFMDFTCDECGEIFKRLDNSKLIKEIKRHLNKIDEKLEVVEIEIEKEKKKLGKKKQIELNKEKKEKELKKEEARKKRAEKKAEKEKLEKKSKKKVVKKKIVKKESSKSKVIKKKPVKGKVVKKKVVRRKLATRKKVVKKEPLKKKIVKKEPAKSKVAKKKPIRGKVVKKKPLKKKIVKKKLVKGKVTKKKASKKNSKSRK